MLGLEYLIAPTTVEDFYTNYAGEKSLFVPGAADKFKDLFAWEDISHAINYGRPSLEGVRLAHEKKTLGGEALANLDHWLARGATLIVNSVQQIDPLMDRFAAALGNDMNTHININSYTSTPEKQGFDSHFDRHDVFIVQIAGNKAWKIFEPTRTWPLDIEVGVKGDPPETEPYLECDLSEGDVLYIPRGHWHYALAQSPSIHLTVGPQPRSGVNFLLWMAQTLMENDEFFRKDFPIVRAVELGGDRTDGALAAHIEEFRKRFRDILDSEALTESLIQYLMTSNPIRKKFLLPELGALADRITRKTQFVIPADQKALVRYDEESKHAVIHVRGHVVQLDDVPPELLEIVFGAEEGSVSAERILARCPDLKRETVQAFLLTLFNQGLLEELPEESAP